MPAARSGGRGGASAEPAAPARALRAAPAAPARPRRSGRAGSRAVAARVSRPPAMQPTPVAERTQARRGRSRGIRSPARGARRPDAAASAAPRPSPSARSRCSRCATPGPRCSPSLQRTKRSAWMVAFTAQVREFRDGDVLVLASRARRTSPGFRGGAPGQSVSELLRSAIAEVLGVTREVHRHGRAAGRRGGDGGARGGSDAATSDEGGAGSVPSRPRPRRSRRRPIRGARRVAACRVRRCIRIGSRRLEAGELVGEALGDGGRHERHGPEGLRRIDAEGRGRIAPTASAASHRTPQPHRHRRPAATAPTGPVDSWATITIPTEPEPDVQAATSAAGSARPTATGARRGPGRGIRRHRRRARRRRRAARRRRAPVRSRSGPRARRRGARAIARAARLGRGPRRRRHPALRRVRRARGARRDASSKRSRRPAAPASGSAGSTCTKASSKS